MGAGKRSLMLLGLTGVFLLAACAAQPRQTVRPIPLVIESRARLMLALDACSEKYGFSPTAPADVAETALAPGEREWRACAHDALRVHALANPEMKTLYEQLIAEDMKMTAAIEAGTLTRRERRDRLDELIVEIKAVEDAHARRDLDIRQIQIQQLRQSFEGVKEFTR